MHVFYFKGAPKSTDNSEISGAIGKNKSILLHTQHIHICNNVQNRLKFSLVSICWWCSFKKI